MNWKPESLEALILSLCENSAIRICMQDVTGEYGGIIDRLPYDLKFHVGPVCCLSKATPRGMGRCAACKFKSIDHARNGDLAYVGSCIFGIYEVVRPVYVHGHVSCMIFVGNLLYDSKKFYNRVRRWSPELGLYPESILEKKTELEPVPKRNPSGKFSMDDFAPYFRRAELIHSYLRLLAEYAPKEMTRKPKSESEQHPIIGNVLAYTDLYYMEPLTVRLLAANNYICENYLGRLFLKEVGMTYSQYLNQTRIRAACELLKNPQNSIASAAISVGYENISYFNRCFKRQLGLTPREYREQIQTRRV